MPKFSFVPLILTLLSPTPETTEARGKAEHIVVVVCDGLRPDFVTPQYTPALYELAVRGTFFKNNHAAYITSTEVNGTALATGMHPDHSGVMANFGYRADLNWLGSYGTESLDAVRRGDMLTQGKYLEAPTIAEILQQAGFPTIIAGAKPVALLHDRAPRKTSSAEKDSVTLFRGQSLPRSVAEGLVRSPEIGAFHASAFVGGFGSRSSTNSTSATNTAPAATESTGFSRRGGGGQGGSTNSVDSWTTKALTRGLWRKGVPKYTLLWLSEPDAAQHSSGVGSEAALAALENTDRNLAAVLKALEDKGVLDKTDIFVVADHGFSTVNRTPEVIDSLKKAKFVADRQFQNPEAGDIMVINLGGSISFYVFEHDEKVIRRLVNYLQGTDYAGVIFSSLPIDGTFPLDQVHVDVANGAPDVIVSMRWSDEKNEYGFPGTIASMDGRRGTGTHASLSRFDLRNTLIAAGPDIKGGYVSDLPSGNIDVVPTVLSLLGVEPPKKMDGRILSEAIISADTSALKPVEQIIDASRDLGLLLWRQYLKTIQIGYATYYAEGNGEARIK